METSGTRHTLGSVAADIQSVRRREDLQGGGYQEGIMVAARGGREAAWGNIGGGAGSKE